MADTSSFSVKTPAARKAPNLSSGWIVMVLSGLIAVVIFFVVTAQGSKQTQVLVAKHDIVPGARVTTNDFRAVGVNTQPSQIGRLILARDAVSYLNNVVAVAPIQQGDLVTKSIFKPASGSGLTADRTISMPVDKARAANGNLSVGDRIDIIDESGDAKIPPAYVATNVLVTGVNTSSGGGLGSSGSSNFVLTLAVNSDQALRVSEALKSSKIDVVRSTGAATNSASSDDTLSLKPTTTSVP